MADNRWKWQHYDPKTYGEWCPSHLLSDNGKVILDATSETLSSGKEIVLLDINPGHQAMIAAAPLMLDVLLELEWISRTADCGDCVEYWCCPKCGAASRDAHRRHHNDGCSLKAAIDAATCDDEAHE